MDALLEAFINEARELIGQMEEGLMALEKTPSDELLHAVFRSAHTIKGAAATVNCASISGFTHVLENTLDLLRQHQRELDPHLIESLLASVDHLRMLVDHFAQGKDSLSEDEANSEATLLAQLVTPGALSETSDRAKTEALPHFGRDCWHLSVRLNRDLYRHGQDPLVLLDALEEIGNIVHIDTVFDCPASLAEVDPEDCLIGFEIQFDSSASKAQIEQIFMFSADEGFLRLIPPNAQTEEYIELIRAMQDNPLRLGEMLLKVGAITEAELKAGLADQDGKTEAPLGEVLVAKGAAEPSVVAAAVDQQQAARERLSKESRLIKVPADKLDQLINLVGELVISGSGAHMIAAACGQRAVLEALQGMSRLTESIRDSALQLRMVPIGELFNRYQRVVRDCAQELDKKINFVLEGSDTELDKSLVDKLADPLLHLVRNAIDHGIEPTSARLAAGKPEAGTLRLVARHDSGNVWIEISDDGNGLNIERIRQKAIANGLIAEDAAMTENELLNLIFEPGFSTADQVTSLSGRGVGMDVVRRTIKGLRGDISIHNRPGQGATFRIRLPLTLAIIDGFLLKVGKHGFVVPLDSVQECLEWREASRIPGSDCIKLRGQAMPCVRLAELFSLESTAGKRENTVIVGTGSERIGLIVDELAGQCQTVIKPLGELFRPLKGIAGSTILGSGEVALILDLQGLLELQELRGSGASAALTGTANNRPSLQTLANMLTTGGIDSTKESEK